MSLSFKAVISSDINYLHNLEHIIKEIKPLFNIMCNKNHFDAPFLKHTARKWNPLKICPCRPVRIVRQIIPDKKIKITVITLTLIKYFIFHSIMYLLKCDESRILPKTKCLHKNYKLLRLEDVTEPVRTLIFPCP